MRPASGNGFGRIDVWVNNAGIAINKFFLDYTEEEWDRIQSINLKGVWNGCRAAAPYMQEQESGVIINISSFAAKIPLADGPIYAASKAGVSSLTKTLAADLAPWGIRVMGVIPGMIRTAISEENIRVNEEKFVQAISMKRLGFRKIWRSRWCSSLPTRRLICPDLTLRSPAENLPLRIRTGPGR